MCRVDRGFQLVGFIDVQSGSDFQLVVRFIDVQSGLG